jgi:serine-protein kinase ATM
LTFGACRDSLGDEGFHQIYEALFRSVRIERTAYVNSSKSSKSSNVSNRLRDSAFVFRLAVELGIEKITSKTANAVIDHIVDTLPVAGDAYCQPLADDYLKILRAILERAAHVEHLRDKKWRALVDFLIQGISHYALEDDHSPSGTDASLVPSQHSRNGRVTSFRISQSSGSLVTRHEAAKPTEDLFFCLDRLTKAGNAPTISRATAITEIIIRFFNSSSPSSSLYQIAFSCLNNVLARIITEDSKLAQRVALEIVPSIRRLWSSKNLILRDEMLITLVLSSDVIKALPKTNTSADMHSSLSNLLEIISVEYSRRHERDILQLDEMSFADDEAQQVMSLAKLRIRPEHTRGTFNWATVSVLAVLTLVVDNISQILLKTNTNDTPSKRRKLSNGVDDVLRQSLSGPSLTKTRALQMIPFLLNNSPAVSGRFQSLLVRLVDQVLDEDPMISAWTMIAISW